MANMHIRFQDDDNSDYNPSDSEDDYDAEEKKLLQKVRKVADSDSEDEVYGVESEDNSDIALSDVEGQEDDDNLPDVRAWGKDKRKFYSTDYVDPDYGGFEGKDAALAELEEEEAKNLQKQLAEQLDDGDFSLEMFAKKKESENKEDLEELIKTDVTQLSKRQKLQLLKRESPEFFELIEDFKVKMVLATETLKPVLTLSENDKIKECEALDFIKFYYHLILNYCTNISVYLLLKASKVNLKSHPIAKRLFQYRQHLSQMEGVFEETIKPQLDILMNLMENDTSPVKKKKTLKLLSNLNKKKKKTESLSEDEQPTKKQAKQDMSEGDNDNQERVKQVNTVLEQFNDESSDSAMEENKEDENEVTTVTGEKRAITYQMAKNKGLTPHRKREQRNPRVKHRNKFRKAKIRRKGAVREVRKELVRYGGETSGIKASVRKSIKIK